MDQGWIKVHRKILENPVVCKDSDHMAVWLYLLLKATHKKIPMMFGKKKIELMPGQLIVSALTISKTLKLSESKVRRCIKSFKIDEQIDEQATRNGRLITILNWESYQNSDEQNDEQVTNKRRTSDEQVTPNKNVRMEECKNVRNNSLTREDVDRVILAWNSFAQNKIHKISPNTTRYTHLKKRIEENGLGEVLRAIKMTSESDFMQGKNKSGWVANFDWLMKPSNFQKTIEGNYRNKKKSDMSSIEDGLKILMNA